LRPSPLPPGTKPGTTAPRRSPNEASTPPSSTATVTPLPLLIVHALRTFSLSNHHCWAWTWLGDTAAGGSAAGTPATAGGAQRATSTRADPAADTLARRRGLPAARANRSVT
jgi:hypothetical protein